MKLKISAVLVIALALVACDSAQDRKTKYMTQAVEKFEEGDLDKARVGLKNVLQIDPKDVEARYLFGQIKEKQQEWRDAAGQYQAVIDNDPQHVGAHVRLGKLYLLGNNVEKAKELLNDALNIDADNIEALSLEAGILLKEGNIESAREKMLTAYEKEPENLDHIIMLANIEKALGNASESKAILNRGLKSNTDSIALRTLLAKQAIDEGDSVKAVELFREMIKVRPEDLEIRTKLALLQTQLKRLDEAEQTLQKAIGDLPDEPKAKLALIDFLRGQRSEEQALEVLEKYIAEETDQAEFYFAKAQILFNQDKKDLAKNTLHEVEKRFEGKPQALEAKNKLAIFAINEGDEGQAKAYVEEVLQENNLDVKALAIRGELAFKEERFSDAVADFRAVLKEEPTNGKIYKALAQAQLRVGDTPLAIENLKKASLLLPSDTNSRILLAKVYKDEGKVEAAEDTLSELVVADPSNIAFLDELIKLQLAQKKYEDALKNADSLVALHPENPLGYFYKGVSYQGQKIFDKSSDNLKKALELEPKLAEPLMALMKNYLIQGKSDKALETLDSALTNNGENAVAYNLKGEVLSGMDKFTEAKQAFENAIKVSPTWWVPYRGLAAIYVKDKNIEEAAATFLKGIEQVEDKNRLRLELSGLYEKTAKFDKAIGQYRDIVAEAKDKDSARNNLAMMLINYKKDDASFKEAEELVSDFKDSSNPMFLDTLGWVKYHNKKYDEAISYLSKSVISDQGNPEFNYHLGRAYLADKQFENAKIHLQKTLNADLTEAMKEHVQQYVDEAKSALNSKQEPETSISG